MTTRTRVKRIDADTHFLPPVDMQDKENILAGNLTRLLGLT
jgi:hypothetical protein